MSTPIPWGGIEQLASAIGAGRLSAREATQAFLSRCDSHGPALACLLHVDHEGAMAQAAAVDDGRAAGRPAGRLDGVPLVVKDNLCTRGVPTTCGSRMLAGWVPPYDAHVVSRLRDAGAIILAKANMDEFSMGSSNETSAFGPASNPWNDTHTPGGSSGGSAAATAAGLAAGALGSDTGGSVRQPAAFCGVTALKPTYGRVSRHGLVAHASSLDVVGPIARSARDAALLLGVIAGHDARDATSALRPVQGYVAACEQQPRGIRVGVLRGTLGDETDPEVASAVVAALEVLSSLGCELVDVELPHAKYGVSAYYLIATAEASSNLARYDGVRFGQRTEADDLQGMYSRTRAQGFGEEVKRRILLGTFTLSSGYYEQYYLRAARVRTLICRDYHQAFERCDVILSPTSPTAAFELGERTADPLSMYMSDAFTVPPSLAGLPAASVPCGMTMAGLPVGMQLTAPAFEEARLFTVAAAYQRTTDWHVHTPPVP